MLVRIDFGSEEAIYMQLCNQIIYKIATADLRQGDVLPSVRDLAAEAQVNPNTMQRALTELEREGLLVSGGTSGRTVTQDTGILTALREDTLGELARECAERFAVFGVTPAQAAELLKKLDNKEEEI